MTTLGRYFSKRDIKSYQALVEVNDKEYQLPLIEIVERFPYLKIDAVQVRFVQSHKNLPLLEGSQLSQFLDNWMYTNTYVSTWFNRGIRWDSPSEANLVQLKSNCIYIVCQISQYISSRDELCS